MAPCVFGFLLLGHSTFDIGHFETASNFGLAFGSPGSRLPESGRKIVCPRLRLRVERATRSLPNRLTPSPLHPILADPCRSLQGPRWGWPASGLRSFPTIGYSSDMSKPLSLPRSPELMSRHDTALLVVDVQTRLLEAMSPPASLVWNIRRLIDGAHVLGLPVEATEQYPKGLGPTTSQLAERLGEIPEKLLFSCRACGAIFDRLRDRGIYKILVVGIETHVCVQQTVLDLLASGFRVYVANDAVGSRSGADRDVALRRMESQGATLTTTEAALFEWCEVAGTAEFKKISALVLEAPPG